MLLKYIGMKLRFIASVLLVKAATSILRRSVIMRHDQVESFMVFKSVSHFESSASTNCNDKLRNF